MRVKLYAGVFAAVLLLSAVNMASAQSNQTNVAKTTFSEKVMASACARLDDTKKRPRMDGLLHKLLVLCNRQHEFGGVESEKYSKDKPDNRVPGTDSLVNDPTGESGQTQTQNETSIARSDTTGTLCSGFNDAYSGVVTNQGFTGFARSSDDGVTFTDGGAFDANSFGDPSMIWRRADNNFYLATLHSDGLGIYRSTDDCQTFSFFALGHNGSSDDKELMAVDNNLASPHYGRIHMVWTNFVDSRIHATYSDDGSNWSTPVRISESGADVQGAWPIIASNGTVYVAWVRWNPFFSGPMDIEVVRSTDGGNTYVAAANPATGVVSPYAAGPTNNCGRPALNGNVRYLASPQIAVTPNGDLHIVYSRDPDGRNSGDVIDVFYRRSVDQGNTWLPEVRLNDDTTITDQFSPTLSAGPTGRLVASWYDRRLDTADNLFVDYYAVMSEDGGASWGLNERISDVSTPIYIDPGLATCYHGDYDTQLQTASAAFIQWADDRAVRSGHNDPDAYFDKNTFAPDFFLTSDVASDAVCAPDSAQYGITVEQSLDFTDPVTLSVSGAPSGTTTSFSVNPVVPEGSSELLVANTANGAPGTYVLEVTGTSGTKNRAAQVVLTLANSVPDMTVLVAPANGAVDQDTQPTLSWAASSQAASYLIEVATDDAFQNIIDSDVVEGTEYTTAVSLAPTTTYYWRVRAANICGNADLSVESSFITRAIICTTVNQAIPDSPSVGIESSVVIPSGGTLADLDVSIVAAHTYVGDLAFTLTHVDTGTSAVIIDRPGRIDSGFGCSSDDIDATLDDDGASPVEDECAGSGTAIQGTFSPNNPLAVFNGEDLSGTWSLSVRDNAGADLGTLNEWCLIPAIVPTVVDTDEDGVTDDIDNCRLVDNADQRDTNGDGFGNICDPDFDNNGIVNFLDISAWTPFFATANTGDLDLNGDGVLNFIDYAILHSYFGNPPGPGAASTR